MQVQGKNRAHFFESRPNLEAKKRDCRLTVVSCHLATIRRTVDHDGARPGAVAATRDHPGDGPRRRERRRRRQRARQVRPVRRPDTSRKISSGFNVNHDSCGAGSRAFNPPRTRDSPVYPRIARRLLTHTIPDVVLPSLRCVAGHSRAVSVASCGTLQITLKLGHINHERAADLAPHLPSQSSGDFPQHQEIHARQGALRRG